MKFLRYLIFIPICLVALGFSYWIFGLLLSWFIGLSTFWLIAILVLFGSTIWGVFKGFSAILVGLTSKLSPNFEFAFWTILVLSIINGIWSIINAWSMNINYNGKVILGAIVFTILIIELTIALILGAAAFEE